MFSTNSTRLVTRPARPVLVALALSLSAIGSAFADAPAPTPTPTPTPVAAPAATSVTAGVAVQPIDAETATGSAGDGSGTVGELGRVNTQMVLQTARLNLKKVNDQLVPDAAREGASSAAPVVQAAADTLPNVRLIINDTASFVFSDGSRATAMVGGTLPGGWKVTEVSGKARSVKVADRKGRVYTLAISSQPPQAAGDPSTGNRMGQPGVPMMGAPMAPMTVFNQRR